MYMNMYVTVFYLQAIPILSASFLCQPYIPLLNFSFTYIGLSHHCSIAIILSTIAIILYFAIYNTDTECTRAIASSLIYAGSSAV